MKKKKVLVLVNDTTYAYNLRKELIQKLIEKQYEVVVACSIRLKMDEMLALGCKVIDVEYGRQGTNPIKDIRLFTQYLGIIRKEKPDIVLTYNIKPNVYGGMV